MVKFPRSASWKFDRRENDKTVRLQLEKANVKTGTSSSKSNLSGSFHFYFVERSNQRLCWKQIKVFPRMNDTSPEVVQSQRARTSTWRSSLRQGPLGPLPRLCCRWQPLASLLRCPRQMPFVDVASERDPQDPGFQKSRSLWFCFHKTYF